MDACLKRIAGLELGFYLLFAYLEENHSSRATGNLAMARAHCLHGITPHITHIDIKPSFNHVHECVYLLLCVNILLCKLHTVSSYKESASTEQNTRLYGTHWHTLAHLGHSNAYDRLADSLYSSM